MRKLTKENSIMIIIKFLVQTNQTKRDGIQCNYCLLLIHYMNKVVIKGMNLDVLINDNLIINNFHYGA